MKCKLIRRSIFLVFLLINVSTYAVEGNSQAQPKIIGGTIAPANTYPWMTALVAETSDGIFQFCGGSLIDENWVITAAHCVEGITNPNILKVYIGGTNVGNLTTTDLIAVRNIIIHPDYNIGSFDSDNDLALLKLSEPSTQTTLPLVDSALESSINIGDSLKVMGWGDTLASFEDTLNPDELMEVDIPLRDRDQCEEYWGSSTFTENMICAGGIEEPLDSCQGDSGGPLIYADTNDENTFKLLGLVSFGLQDCANQEVPAVYTRVSRYTDIINNVINGITPNTFNLSLGFTKPNTELIKSFVLNNYSDTPEVIQSVSLDSSNGFSIISDECSGFTLIEDQQCTITVIFQNITNGIYTTDLEINTSSVVTPTINIALKAEILPPIDLTTALDITDGPDSISPIWFIVGDVKWSEVIEPGAVGGTAVKTDSIGNSQKTLLQTEVEGPLRVDFCWKTSSEESFDFLIFKMDESIIDQISGETNFESRSFDIPEGVHTLAWEFVRDETVSAGEDAAYLDKVRFSRNPSDSNNPGTCGGGGGGGGGSLPLWFALLLPLLLIGRLKSASKTQ